MLQGFMKHFVEADRVYKETSVYSIDHSLINILTLQVEPANIVSFERCLLRRLENNTWYIEVLGVC